LNKCVYMNGGLNNPDNELKSLKPYIALVSSKGMMEDVVGILWNANLSRGIAQGFVNPKTKVSEP